MKLLFAANWKMNMLRADVVSFCRDFAAICPELTATAKKGVTVEVAIAPPYTSISTVKECLGELGVLVGAQNVHWLDSGAHTGEISPPMLKDIGAQFAIIGHSERRQFYGETSAAVAKRAHAAVSHGLRAIVCVGELLAEFEANRTDEVVKEQLLTSLEGISNDDAKNIVIAYEPVWAIGTGKAATPEIAERVHGFIRDILKDRFAGEIGQDMLILYGGSTSPENISELVRRPNIGGALIGGASLKVASFSALIRNGSA
jgi:triosephosphate isomerase (TIM)